MSDVNITQREIQDCIDFPPAEFWIAEEDVCSPDAYNAKENAYVPINVIYAPPNSGKSTLLSCLRLPHDILFDTDLLYTTYEWRKSALWTITSNPDLIQRALGKTIAVVPAKHYDGDDG